MIRVACHCGKVRLVVDPEPKWVNDCNCSICRRYGALWAYVDVDDVQARLVQGADDIAVYSWQNHDLHFNRCRHCGCVTHWSLKDSPKVPRGVNARMFVDFDTTRVKVRRSDDAGTGRFWTRPDLPIARDAGVDDAPPHDPESWL